MAPDLSLAGVRLIIADRAMGLPVLRTLSLCTCCRHYPGAAAGHTLRSASPSRISLPRKGCRVGLRIVLFEACSAFTRVTACTLALPPIRDTLIEGFSHFVTSMTAPIASGWSGCRVGLAPTGKRRLVNPQRTSAPAPGTRLSISLRSATKSMGFVKSASAPPSNLGRLPGDAFERLQCCLVGKTNSLRRLIVAIQVDSLWGRRFGCCHQSGC